MSTGLITLSALGLGGAALEYLRRNRAASSYPVISDREFLERLEVDPPRHAAALECREHIASVLGLPSDRLDPAHKISELSSSIGFLGSFAVAWSDLEFELLEEYQERGLQVEPEAFETLGQYIIKRLYIEQMPGPPPRYESNDRS